MNTKILFEFNILILLQIVLANYLYLKIESLKI
nr:MAG TPA: hypothetical protein [Caudoviricetes sp.]